MIQEFDQIETLDVKKPKSRNRWRNPCKVPAGSQQPPGRAFRKRRRRSSRSGSSGLFTLLLLQPEFQGIPPWHEKTPRLYSEILVFVLLNGSVHLQAKHLKKARILKDLPRSKNWQKWHLRLFPSETRPVKDGF